MDGDIHNGIRYNKIAGSKIKLDRNTNIYPIKNMLADDVNMSGIRQVSLCIYRIFVKPSVTPILQYLLFRNNDDVLVFPSFKVGGQISLGSLANDMYNKVTGTSAGSQNYRVSFRKDDVLYLFYQHISGVNDNPYKTKSDELWWCLMDEICNWRRVVTMPVDTSVYSLFYDKPELIYLYDTNYNKLEVPIVGYHGTYHKLLEFIYTFGVKENDLRSMYGPYYYFTTFNRAIKYGGWYFQQNKELIKEQVGVDEHGRFDKGGVIRTALFMNNMKTFLNHPLDDVDNSEYTAMAMNNIETRENMKVKLKLVDYDASWTADYDSVYAGRTIMDNGEKLFVEPEMVVKTNSQQVMMSIHIIDKKTLGEKWDSQQTGYDIV